MSEIALKIENLSKQYRLGVVGTQTLRGDLQRFWWKLLGKGDPTLKIGQENTLAEKGGEYVWALKDINLEVKKGEVLGIIGKNGAGKSTLLKILSRVTGPTTGNVNVNGRLASLLEVGTGFHPELTGKENIFLNGAIMGMTKIEIKDKLDEIIEFAGIAKFIDTPVKRYSSGMYVRLGFAVAAHLSSEILVVDEVLAVGDAEFQKKAIGKMQDVSKGEGRTVLFVSHNMASVKQLCTRGILLNNGTIAFDGNVKETIDTYIHSRKNEKKISLLDRTDRDGVGHVKAVDTWLENSENKIVNSFQTGDDVFIVVKIEQQLEQYVSGNMTVSFALNTIENIQICDISNYFSGEKIIISNTEKEKIIKVKLKKMPLNEGIYYYNIMLRFAENVQDWVKEANTFEINQGDFYNTGIVSENRLLNLDYKWNY